MREGSGILQMTSRCGHLVLSLGIPWLFSSSLACAEGPLTSLHEVRSLDVERATVGQPVKVEGLVLGIEPGNGSRFFLHDGTAGCYVKTRDNQPLSLKPGDRVLVEGITDPMGFYPSIRDGVVMTVGRGTHPAPAKPDLTQLFSPELDSAWVEVPAVITGYETRDDRLTLSVEVHAQPFKAELPLDPQSYETAAKLMLRRVRLQGVMGTIFNRQRQMTDRHFFVPSFDFITPVVGIDSDVVPQSRQITRLLTGDTGPDLRVRLIGTVTQMAAGGFYLRDETGSTFVQAAVNGSIEPGMEVEIEGYAAVAPYRPMLRASSISPTGRRLDITPVSLDPGAIDLSPLHSERVTVDAEFLGVRQGINETILQLESEGRFFEALLPASTASNPTPQPGDRVRLVGICELTTTHALPRPSWVDGFRIHLQEAGGLVIIRRAPWWTPRRLLAALGLTSGAAALGFLASWMLRRQVKRQLAVIGEQLRSEVIGEERDRMARELHDTLEQQLSGVALQLDSLDHAIRATPDSALDTLALARRMLRFTRTEARRSVWDLRSEVLEKNGLAAALRDVAEGAASASGPRIEVRVTGPGGVLPPRVDFHFLRIAQEAVTNALKHSQARNVTIHLDHNEDRVSLSICDDGVGFDSAADRDSRSGPHFGLLGMRERAARIGARLEVSSAPGQGCSVAVTMHLTPQSHE